jgi:ArsR family transcriptional regulator, arsenate/arsenite/antimonite-responsive transcriptional repressor
MRELADIHKALADETRLQMLVLLQERDELCVCDFVGTLDITQSKASRHLRYLYNTGLLADRRAGLWIHYRIAPDLSPSAQEALESLRRSVDQKERSELRNRLDQWLDQKVAGGFGTCLG